MFFYLPLVVLVINSFNAARFGGRWDGFSLQWYERLLENARMWEAVRASLWIGVVSSCVSMVLGTTAALALQRYRHTALQRLHATLIYTPLVVPDILVAMSLLLLFVGMGWTLGFATVTIAHISFSISYVALVVTARLDNFDQSLLDAARDLGATRWQAVHRVLLPLLLPGILSGGLLAFTLSIDDYVVTSFVRGAGMETLPTMVYGLIKRSREPAVINALSTILLAITFASVFAAHRAVAPGSGKDT